MPYRPLHDLLPALAERETRTLIVPPGATKAALPEGEYGLVEMFCDEPDCDCRRVFLCVLSSRQPGPEAVIAWGWRSREFCARWSGEDDEDLLDTLKGPALNLGSTETELAPTLLELVTEMLGAENAYAARIQEHYRMFRARLRRKEAGPGWFDTAGSRSQPGTARRRS